MPTYAPDLMIANHLKESVEPLEDMVSNRWKIWCRTDGKMDSN